MCFKNIFASSQGTLFAVGVEGFNIEQNLQVLKYFAFIFQFLFLFLMILYIPIFIFIFNDLI